MWRTQQYWITLSGCDGSTIFKMWLDDDEYELLKKVSELSKKESSYNCMPTMEVELVQDIDEKEE